MKNRKWKIKIKKSKSKEKFKVKLKSCNLSCLFSKLNNTRKEWGVSSSNSFGANQYSESKSNVRYKSIF